MKSARIFVLAGLAFIFAFSSLLYAGVPQMINYQGKITTPQGFLIDATVSMVFTIYDDSIGGSAWWTETQPSVVVQNGVFSLLLGSVNPIPDTVFTGDVRYLGIKVGDDLEMTQRKAIVSVGYAMKAGNARDLYHQIIDVMPYSITKFYVVPKYPDSKATLYLYGEGFGGTTLAHTHSGNNAHGHSFSATTGSESAGHTHGFSGNTGNQSTSHTHSGSTSSIDLAHSHSGGVGDNTHSHPGSVGDSDPRHVHWNCNTGSSTDHSHTLAVDGVNGTGIYLVHNNDVNGLSSSNTADRYCTGSIMLGGSHSHTFHTTEEHINHNHPLAINNSTHNHSLSINSGLASHSHSFTTGGISTNHTHAFSGTTGAISANHNHSFSGTTGSSGSGLGMFGVVAGTYPQSVNVYVDGVLRAGSWSGQFSSGPVDLSPYISDTGEHAIEIKEEGGNGGRIIYNLYLE
jgi:hypothetical protein